VKRYRFSLETALRVRRVQEEAAGFALARANHDLQRAMDTYRGALARYEALAPAHGTQELSTFRRDRDEAERMAASVQAAWVAVDVATDEVAARHAEWLAASRRVAALEKLDDRRRAEWLVEERRAEVAAIDESAISRWLADTMAAPAGETGTSP